MLTAAKSALAIIFVGLLRIAQPDEWPPLHGNPFQAYTIQRLWGVFWHQIGAPSQLHYGRFTTRRVLRLEPGISVEKMTLALWVFAVSGTIYALVTWKTKPEADPVRDLRFLMLNFPGGLAEMAMGRTNLVGGGRQSVSVLSRLMGYLCILAFSTASYRFPVPHPVQGRRQEDAFQGELNIGGRA
ncbi:hypothetical protein J3458_004415 [Metarhizium acridum]|uniref:uncharacterized protein n=1 Tax=Metarhizium acridum TaxID=92637 RepID=UPI001C6CC146|nr:hypothetical protein J3458_004415 [Metarhizium acridum]